jgi:membrane protease YdiL (CAAX protease family)
MDALRSLAPLALAFATALLVDRGMARRGLLPPGFVGPPADSPTAGRTLALTAARRAAGLVVVALALWVGVFLPLGLVGLPQEVDFSQLSAGRLFLLHAFFALSLVAWLVLGFGPRLGVWGRQLGLRAKSVPYELAIGVASGVLGWAAVLAILMGVGSLLWYLLGPDLLPTDPPEMVPWLAGLPWALRAAVSLSAGVVEEAFFRGFLQPRIGIAASGGLFVLAHLSYEQPLMLVGIALLSILFALLVRWRQSIWAAIAAHAVFDAVQLLVLIPWAMRMIGGGG